MPLRVLARSGLVSDYARLAASIAAGVALPHADKFVGRAFVPDASGATAGAWVAKSEPTDVPNVAEYRNAVVEGSLWPADEATAKACGVPFDPFFGGQFAEPAA